MVRPLSFPQSSCNSDLVAPCRYENEHACGKAISDWLEDHPQVTREEIFYTTKLKTNVSRIDTVDKIKKSLKTSTLSYIDLYLLHSPIGGPKVREECWAGCMDAKEYGWVKSIGVSNYGVKHIQEFEQARDRAQKAGKKYEMPVLNQVDLHPFMRREAIVDICEKNDILLEVRVDLLLSNTGIHVFRFTGMGPARPWSEVRPPSRHRRLWETLEIPCSGSPPMEYPTCTSFPHLGFLMELTCPL